MCLKDSSNHPWKNTLKTTQAEITKSYSWLLFDKVRSKILENDSALQL